VFGQNGSGAAERDVYADFLDEAAVILQRPGLREAAAQFRKSAAAWQKLPLVLLPEDIAPFKETRELTLHRHQLFLAQGNGAQAEMEAIDRRLAEIKGEVAADFPLDAAGVVALREEIAVHVLGIHDVEETAVATLREAMA
jgi:hypothetical protein